MKISVLLVLLLVSITCAEAQDTLLAFRLQERAYVQTDRLYYYAGETIWYSGFMRYRSTGAADSLSRVVYVELLSPQNQVVASSVQRVVAGRFTGRIKMPLKMLPGNYFLRAYTNWMKNYGADNIFYKCIPILNDNDKAAGSSSPPLKAVGPVKILFNNSSYLKGDSVAMTLIFTPFDTTGTVTFCVSVTNETYVLPIASKFTILNLLPGRAGIPPTTLPVFRYEIEKGIAFKAAFVNRKGLPEQSNLTIIQERFQNIYKINTDAAGEFSFHDLDFYDTMHFAVQTKKGSVILKPKVRPGIPRVLPNFYLPVVQENNWHRRTMTDGDEATLLKTVDVTVKREYQNPNRGSDYYIASEKLRTYTDLVMLITAQAPIYRLASFSGKQYLNYIRGKDGDEPALFINNDLVTLSAGESVADRLGLININTVDHLEINALVNSGTGANGRSGAIYVYTRMNYDNEFKALPQIKIRGYDSPKEFLIPPGSGQAENLPPTIYWNPLIKLTRKQGKMIVSFPAYSGGINYRIVLEGITQSGNPFRSEAQISIRP